MSSSDASLQDRSRKRKARLSQDISSAPLSTALLEAIACTEAALQADGEAAAHLQAEGKAAEQMIQLVPMDAALSACTSPMAQQQQQQQNLQQQAEDGHLEAYEAECAIEGLRQVYGRQVAVAQALSSRLDGMMAQATAMRLAVETALKASVKKQAKKAAMAPGMHIPPVLAPQLVPLAQNKRSKSVSGLHSVPMAAVPAPCSTMQVARSLPVQLVPVRQPCTLQTAQLLPHSGLVSGAGMSSEFVRHMPASPSDANSIPLAPSHLIHHPHMAHTVVMRPMVQVYPVQQAIGIPVTQVQPVQQVMAVPVNQTSSKPRDTSVMARLFSVLQQQVQGRWHQLQHGHQQRQTEQHGDDSNAVLPTKSKSKEAGSTELEPAAQLSDGLVCLETTDSLACDVPAWPSSRQQGPDSTTSSKYQHHRPLVRSHSTGSLLVPELENMLAQQPYRNMAQCGLSQPNNLTLNYLMQLDSTPPVALNGSNSVDHKTGLPVHSASFTAGRNASLPLHSASFMGQSGMLQLLQDQQNQAPGKAAPAHLRGFNRLSHP